MPAIALATCLPLADGDPDDQPLLAALERRRIDARFAAWDDPDVDWAAFDLTVVRSTWNYVERRDDFLAWAERVPRLANPAEVLRWNTDKRYLAELEDAGLPVVPTQFVEPDGALPQLAGEVVVKPAVGAGSLDAQRHSEPRAAADHVYALLRDGRTAMVQPYERAIEADGETALLYLGGTYSHAVRKAPMLVEGAARDEHGLYLTEDIAPREPAAEHRELADRVMAWVADRFGTLAYARVDVLPGPRLIEVELTEPSLFMAHAPGAHERFAQVLVDLVSDRAPA